MLNEAFSVAIVDDDAMMSQLIEDMIGKKFTNARIAHYRLGEDLLSSGLRPDVAILDYHLDSLKADAMNGLQVLSKLKERHSELPVIFLTAQDKLDIATNTIKYGAYDYIVKNETAFARLENAMTNVLQLHLLQRTNRSQGIMNKIFWVLVATLIGYTIYLRMH
jgi:two-component system OmpR family response regulator